MNISEVVDSIMGFFVEIMNQKCRILSIIPKENAWEALCEVNIDPDYTGRRGLDDAVEIYKVYVDNSNKISGFTLEETKRKALLDRD